MRRSQWIGVAGPLLAVTLAACGGADPSPPTPADLQDIDLAVDHTIAVDDDGFDPTSLEVTAGEVIRLVNEGTGPHSFTTEDRSLDTGRLEPDENVTLVITEPGTVTFFDVEEPSHEGTLTVRPLEGQ
jgi:plastocyanin